MAQNEMTVEDFFNSLNGFDEIAISRSFGQDVMALKEKGTTLIRALVFVDFRRQGKKDTEAHRSSMELTIKDLESYFAEDEEMTPDDPETDQGKEEEPSY